MDTSIYEQRQRRASLKRDVSVFHSVYDGSLWNLHDPHYFREVEDIRVFALYAVEPPTISVEYITGPPGERTVRAHGPKYRQIQYVVPKLPNPSVLVCLGNMKAYLGDRWEE